MKSLVEAALGLKMYAPEDRFFKYFIIPLHAFVVMERLSYAHILLLLPLHDHLIIIVDEHVVELKKESLIIRTFSSSSREIRTKGGTSLPMAATESTCL